ncbi:MAG: hypothetical protein ACR2LR_00030 [Hassallia sp.]
MLREIFTRKTDLLLLQQIEKTTMPPPTNYSFDLVTIITKINSKVDE